MAAQASPPLPSSFLDGVRAAAPVMLGYVPIGIAFGVLARAAGLSVAETGLMSLLVYAGSAQFIGTGLIAAGAGAPSIIATTFLVNLRHLLMSTALVPSLRQNAPWQNTLLAYGITDETFAVNTSLLQGRPVSTRFVAGLHIVSHAAWVAASVVGALAGHMVGDTNAYGLDFALPAMFVGLLMPNLRGEDRSARFWAAGAAALVAVGISVAFPGTSWAVILATVIAATVGVIRQC